MRLDWDGGAVAGEQTITALVPARTLQEVGKTFGHSGTISVAITSRDDRELIAFSAEKKTVTSLAHQGQLPAGAPALPRDGRELRGHEHRRAHRGDASRVARARARGGRSATASRPTALTLEAIGSEQAQASETIDAILTGDDTVVSLKPQFLLDGLGAVHSEFVRISFTKTENPNKPGPVLITSQSSRDQAGADSYRYLLQPNLLLR